MLEKALHIFKQHKEKILYLIVGGWNTVFGYAAFLLLYSLFVDDLFASNELKNVLFTANFKEIYSRGLHYLLILIPTHVISISNAFVCYKLIVFRTKTNFIEGLKEYFRFYLVYGVAALINFALLPLFVEVLGFSAKISQAAIIFMTIIISYVGHKYFTFKKIEKVPR